MDSEKGGRAITSVQGRYDVCRVVDRGRGKRRASRIFAEGIAAKGSVSHGEETQDSLSVRENEERDGRRLLEYI